MKKLISSILVLILLTSTLLITPIATSAKTTNYSISANGKWNEIYSNEGETNTFKINVTSTGKLTINMLFRNYGGLNYYKLYDEDYQRTFISDRFRVNNNVPGTVEESRILTKGTYYLVITTDDESGYIKVKAKLNSYGCNTKDISTYESPNVMSNNKVYTAASTETNDEYDWYKFTIPSKRTVKLSSWSYYRGINYYVYSKDLQKGYFGFGYLMHGSEQSPETRTDTLTLNKGTYYIKVYKGYNKGKYKIRCTHFTKPKLNCTSTTIKRNKTKQLKVSGGIGTIKWSSTNKSIAAVNSKGKVTAKKKKGTCYIKATRNGYSMVCKVRVK